ncbi:MAG: hypothetical protein HYT08_04185 [Candidatus Levybacteria bacterium]|nr:hypothetical protein [Candidatus Levybacteria bacterium]
MADFKFIQNPNSQKWVILAPRRSKRPDAAIKTVPVCPFCLGREKEEPDVYRVGGELGDSNWQVRVIPNKFPFSQIHEVIIHSPDHHKNFGELPLDQTELILKTYRQRFNTHKDKGQVYIFNNRGEGGGESLPHPHTQLVVVPRDVAMDIPQSSSDEESIETEYFLLKCPATSQWPDEVWITPKKRNTSFGEINDQEISNLAFALNRVIRILDLRHGYEFPYNFYIFPGNDWYLRIIPRVKSLGGFEIGTGVYVNTQDPKETFAFIKEHFESPDEEKIRKENQAEYRRSV